MEIEQFEFFPLWWTFASRPLPDPFRTASGQLRIPSGPLPDIRNRLFNLQKELQKCLWGIEKNIRL